MKTTPREKSKCFLNNVETKHKKENAHAGLDVASSSRALKGWKNFNFAAKAFQRNREFLPQFKITMRPSYIKGRCMAIPAAFAKRYFEMNEAPVSLKVSDKGSNWEVKYKCWTANENNNRNKYKFQDGWNRFVRENQLKVDDVCDFILGNSKPIRFTIVIYRAAENPSCSRSKKAQPAYPPVASRRHNEEVVDSDDEESDEEPQPKKKKTLRSKATPSVKPPKPQPKAKQTTKAAVKRKDDATPSKASSKAQKPASPASISNRNSSDPDSVSLDSKQEQEKVDKPNNQHEVNQRIEIPEASYDMEVLLGNLPQAHLPLHLKDTLSTVIKPEKLFTSKLEDLIDFLSEAGRRSSRRSARSSNLKGQECRNSQAVKLMQNLKSLFKHPLNKLCTDSAIRSEMAKLLMELELIRNNLPASNRSTLASVQDFFSCLSKKVSTINEVVPSFEAEELNRDNLLNTLCSMKATKDKETRLISAGIQAKLETDKKIVKLEAELKEAKLRSLRFEQALSACKEKVRKIDEDSNELGTTARAIVNKLQTMEPEYLAAKAEKESLEKTWEEIRNSES